VYTERARTWLNRLPACPGKIKKISLFISFFLLNFVFLSFYCPDPLVDCQKSSPILFPLVSKVLVKFLEILALGFGFYIGPVVTLGLEVAKP
jgi:hypothetical protein